MRQGKTSTIMVGSVVAIALLIIAPAFIYWRSQTSIPTVNLPTPNAYDLLVQAGSQVGKPPDNIEQADAKELAAFLAANDGVMPLIRQALQHESCVPIDYAADFLSQELDRTDAIRQTARLLMAEARLAEQQGRNAKAAETYLDLVDLSRKMSRGGLFIHLMLGAAYERVAWAGLLRIEPSLSPEEKGRFLAKIKSIGDQPEDLQATIDRERALSTAVNGWLITRLGSRLPNEEIDRSVQLQAELRKLRQDVRHAMHAE